MVSAGNFRNFRNSGGDRTLRSTETLNTVEPGGRKKARMTKTVKLATINIQHGGNAKLEHATRCLKTMNIDIAILTETKLPQHHTVSSEGYSITVSDAVSNSKGGVALCVRNSRYFGVEGTKTYGNNVVSTQLVSGKRRWLLIGVYIPPSEVDHTTIMNVEKAARVAEEEGIPIVLLGDLNIDFDFERGYERYTDREMAIWTTLGSLQLIDLSKHFKQTRGRAEWTWRQYRERRLITSKVDYIMTTDRSDFRYHRVKVPLLDTDHRMIVVGLDMTEQNRIV